MVNIEWSGKTIEPYSMTVLLLHYGALVSDTLYFRAWELCFGLYCATFLAVEVA